MQEMGRSRSLSLRSRAHRHNTGRAISHIVVPRNHLHLAADVGQDHQVAAALDLDRLTNEELLLQNANDPNTKRGAKLSKDRKSAQ